MGRYRKGIASACAQDNPSRHRGSKAWLAEREAELLPVEYYHGFLRPTPRKDKD
jgi:hypothetical protein